MSILSSSSPSFIPSSLSSTLKSSTYKSQLTTYNPEYPAPSSINLIIYHKNCPDGYGSAFSGCIPSTHGDKPPNVEGKNVAIVDYSYDAKTIEAMIKSANSLIIIDHHASAEVELSLIPDKYKIFDKSHSGAVLSWNYFNPGTEVPLFIRYIEDKDIWKWEMPNSKEFSSSLTSIPFEFLRYKKLMQEENVNELLLAGKYRLELQDSLMTSIAKRASIRYISLNHLRSITSFNASATSQASIDSSNDDKDIYTAFFVNSSVLQSEIGNYLLDKPKNITSYRTYIANNSTLPPPVIEVAVVFSYNTESKTYNISLRSQGVDVAKMAKILGGGGHIRASGFNYDGDIENLFVTL